MVHIDTDSDDELAAGWEERVTTDGKVYYANHFSQVTQWKNPSTGRRKRIMGELPFGWEQKINDDGLVYYVDNLHKKTTYTDPRLAFAVDVDAVSNAATPNGRIRQRFDASTRALRILVDRDLSKVYVIVTGANCGIGYETARSLAFGGAHVVFACRDLSLAREAMTRVTQERPLCKVSAMHLDLMRLSSVQKFSDEYLAQQWPLHILVLNAAVFCPPYTLSEDGYEATFQTNHLAHFYLLSLLTPVLVQSAPARVIAVSSEAHRWADLDVDTISRRRLSPPADAYSGMMAYNQSKLCNVLMCGAAQRRLSGQGVHFYSVHPGNVVSTSLPRHSWMLRLVFALVRPFTKDKQQAAATSVFCATARELQGAGGLYFNNCCRCQPSAAASNKKLADTLWDLSVEMVSQPASLL